jgi:hypothetical protein
MREYDANESIASSLGGGSINLGGPSGEAFAREKCELFPVLLAVMIKNKDIFRHLLKAGAFIYNDLHFVILTNILFDSGWVEGILTLLESAPIQQAFL